MQQFPLLWALLGVLASTQASLQLPQNCEEDITPHQTILQDLKRKQKQNVDFNRQPLLPTNNEWQSDIASWVPSTYIDAAPKLEQSELLVQLQQQHSQLSGGSPTPCSITATSTTTSPATMQTRFLQPIVPFNVDLQLQLNGVYANMLSSSTSLLSAIPRPSPESVRHPYPFLQQEHQRETLLPTPGRHITPTTFQLPMPQSKQLAYAPVSQRNYASAARVPVPYPPSFVSITTRPPVFNYAARYSTPFQVLQSDMKPDLFAGRDFKSLLDSYIPSWKVLRLYQQHQANRSLQQHTLAFAVPNLNVLKRNIHIE